MKRDVRFFAGMNTDSRNFDALFDRSLKHRTFSLDRGLHDL
jgi:hypothetical protein